MHELVQCVLADKAGDVGRHVKDPDPVHGKVQPVVVESWGHKLCGKVG